MMLVPPPADAQPEPLTADELDALRRLAALGLDRIRALGDLADGYLDYEAQTTPDPEPAPTPRPLPVVQDGRLVHPIACVTRVQARRRDEALPDCTWAPDVCGYVCVRCGRWEGAETVRGEFMAERFAEGESAR